MKRSQAQRWYAEWSQYMKYPEQVNPERENTDWQLQAWSVGGVARDCLIGKGLYFWVMVCLELNKGGVVQHCIFWMLLIFHFKMVNFSWSEFHLNKLFLILIELLHSKTTTTYSTSFLVGSIIWHHFFWASIQHEFNTMGLYENNQRKPLNSQEY